MKHLPLLGILLAALSTLAMAAPTPSQEDVIMMEENADVTEETEINEEEEKMEDGRTEYDISVFKRMVTERIRFVPTPAIAIRIY